MITFGYNAGSTVQGTFTIYSADNQFDKELVSETRTAELKHGAPFNSARFPKTA